MKTVCFVLICFLWCLNGALFGVRWEERINVTLKIGENVTLQLPVNDRAVGEIEHVIWSKGNYTLLHITNTSKCFMNNTYKSIIYSNHISSMTIRKATGSNTGMYTAQITYKNETNKPTKSEIFYVAEHLDFCGGTTNHNKTEGENVTLHVKNCKCDSVNPKLSIYDNGALSIPNVTKEDEGNYTVIIVKKDSACNHTYILSSSPSNFCGGTTNHNKTEGENVTFHVKNCKCDSVNPKLSIYDNGTLSIPNVTREDGGKYTVIIVKKDSACNHTYILSISPSTGKTSWWATTNISLSCIFLLNFIFIICKTVKNISENWPTFRRSPHHQ